MSFFRRPKRTGQPKDRAGAGANKAPNKPSDVALVRRYLRHHLHDAPTLMAVQRTLGNQFLLRDVAIQRDLYDTVVAETGTGSLGSTWKKIVALLSKIQCYASPARPVPYSLVAELQALCEKWDDKNQDNADKDSAQDDAKRKWVGILRARCKNYTEQAHNFEMQLATIWNTMLASDVQTLDTLLALISDEGVRGIVKNGYKQLDKYYYKMRGNLDYFPEFDAAAESLESVVVRLLNTPGVLNKVVIQGYQEHLSALMFRSASMRDALNASFFHAM